MSKYNFKPYKWIALLAVFTISTFQLFSTFAANDKTIRLAVVNTPTYSGFIDYLLKDFQADTGYSVEVYSGYDVYDVAQDGKADIVISHFGKADVELFVLDGYGRWPVTLFSNQAVIIGPESDPANIKNLSSATEAFRRIAETQSPYIADQIPGVLYLTSILSNTAAWPENTPWVVDESVAKAEAVKLAEQKQGYTIWGALPFLKFKKKSNTTMDIMVSDDPILQRVMVSIIVNPDKTKGVNVEGAESLQEFLLDPKTQAKIAAYRTPDSDRQLWWPAGRDN